MCSIHNSGEQLTATNPRFKWEKNERKNMITPRSSIKKVIKKNQRLNWTCV